MPQKNVNDHVFSKGDGGTPVWAVQQSATAALSSDGKYAPLQVDENGALKIAGSLSLGANQTVNISQIGGQTAATGGAGILSVALGGTSTVSLASGTATIGALTANQSINISQVGGNTAATGAAGVLSINSHLLAGQAMATGGTGIQQVASNVNQIGGQTAATAAAGVLSVGINSAANSLNISQVGGNTAATAAAGTLSVGITGTPTINVGQVGGQTAATGAAGVLSINNHLIGGQTIATAAAGVQSIDIGRLGGSAVVTASAGIQRVQTLASFDTRILFASGLAKAPSYVIISASAAGTADVIASATSTSYLILGYNLMSNGSCTAQFFSNTTPLSGKIPMVTGGVGKVVPFSPAGWFLTTAAHNLKINLSVAAEVTGEIIYISI